MLHLKKMPTIQPDAADYRVWNLILQKEWDKALPLIQAMTYVEQPQNYVLHRAIRLDAPIFILDALFSVGYPINERCPSGWTPLDEACGEALPHLVAYLLQKGADVHGGPNNINTALPLALAANSGCVESIKLLLAAGADVNRRTKYTVTPLHTATHNNHLECMKLLLQHGADVNAVVNNGVTPLHWAGNDVERTKLLVEAGADVTLGQSHMGRLVNMTNEHEMAGVLTCMEYLLNKGAYVDAREIYSKKTALHIASGFSIVPYIEMLLRFGADIGARDCDERTPLHYAADAHRVEAMRVLVLAGADLTARDYRGYTPYDIVDYPNKGRTSNRMEAAKAYLNSVAEKTKQ
jgi:ankyrin repeat protein